ncbi:MULTISPECIES: hypothetical protein [unclassified Roseobacter]|nr:MULTISPECIES: hypothetical protein [unclassified Roseobacter]
MLEEFFQRNGPPAVTSWSKAPSHGIKLKTIDLNLSVIAFG